MKPDIMMPLIFNLVLQGSSSQELYDFRVMFEQAVAEFAMDRATDDDIRMLEEELEYFRKSAKTERPRWRMIPVSDKKLLDICQNAFITQIGTLLLEIFEAPMKRLEHYDAEQALKDHELVLQAFKAGNRNGVKASVKNRFRFIMIYLELKIETAEKNRPGDRRDGLFEEVRGIKCFRPEPAAFWQFPSIPLKLRESASGGSRHQIPAGTARICRARSVFPFCSWNSSRGRMAS